MDHLHCFEKRNNYFFKYCFLKTVAFKTDNFWFFKNYRFQKRSVKTDTDDPSLTT